MAVGTNATGGSYNFSTGYTFPEYSVQKGVPYTHFQKTVMDNQKKSKTIKSQIYTKLNAIA